MLDHFKNSFPETVIVQPKNDDILDPNEYDQIVEWLNKKSFKYSIAIISNSYVIKFKKRADALEFKLAWG